MKNTERRIISELLLKKHLLFVLVDSQNTKDPAKLARKITRTGADGILVGGSTISDQIELDSAVKAIKRGTHLPVILFPGNITGISRHADAIFFSSLLNSEDPYFLIGAQALGAYSVKKYDLEAIPMAYIIAGEGGAAGFVGRSRTFPQNKPELIALYALAAGYLGMRFLYLEAGSGASVSISEGVVRAVKDVYDGKIIVGGGIRDANAASKLSKAGADILVIGNLIEEPGFEKTLRVVAESIHAN